MIVSEHTTQQFKHVYTFVKHPDYYTHNNGNKYGRNARVSFGNDKDIIKLWDLKFRINGYIDEAGQLTEPQVLGPLRKCRKFVLVGDNYQLPPLVQCRESARKGMSVSLFEKLALKYETLAVKALTIQYRMNTYILDLSNELTYSGKMKCANDMIAQRRIKLARLIEDKSMKDWLKCALSPDKTVILLNIDALYSESECLILCFWNVFF